MNAEEAMAVVNRLAFVVQRMRSESMEMIQPDKGEMLVLEDLQPWVYGKKCILPTLAQIQDRGSVTPGELYNLCYIAHRLEPGIGVSAGIMKAASGFGVEIPEPDIRWNLGWTS